MISPFSVNEKIFSNMKFDKSNVVLFALKSHHLAVFVTPSFLYVILSKAYLEVFGFVLFSYLIVLQLFPT